ncbi:hypothetical protein DRN63_03955 [Nanoarchaeota archaeon]|nr:MAG: hypothetical protein DRN63_03955 [Nanoarchaeota archaeon]
MKRILLELFTSYNTEKLSKLGVFLRSLLLITIDVRPMAAWICSSAKDRALRGLYLTPNKAS